VCSWRCLHSLTPDASQLAQHDWKPQALSQLSPLPPALQSAAAAAAAGDILPLKLLVLDVLLAPADGSDRSTNPQADPVVAIACQITHTSSSSGGGSGDGGGGGGGSIGSSRRQGGEQTADLAPAGEDAAAVGGDPTAAAAAAAGSNGSSGSNGCRGGSKVVFLLGGAGGCGGSPGEVCAEGMCVVLCGSEMELLTAWRNWVLQQDPDGYVVFQVGCQPIKARFQWVRVLSCR
jgi:hypothetical protein